MKVYIAEVCIDYEGCEVIGIYSTEDRAEEAIQKNKRYRDYSSNVYCMTIDEVEDEKS